MNARAPFASDAEIEAIAKGLIAHSWPKENWTHDCHWAAALWLLARDGLAATSRDMPGMIRSYNEAVGGRNTDTEGYHETITQASLIVAARALADTPGAPLHTVCNTLCAGPHGRAKWIEDHWSPEHLFTPRARREWVAPDRAPLISAPATRQVRQIDTRPTRAQPDP